MVDNDRRRFLKTAAVGGAALAAIPFVNACKKTTKSDGCECVPSGDATGEAPKVLQQPINPILPGNPRPAPTPDPSSNPIPSGAIADLCYRVEIQGMFSEVPDVISIQPGKLTVPIVSGGQSNTQTPPGFSYGTPVWDKFILTVKKGAGATKLQEWLDEAAKQGGESGSARRDITIYLLARDKATVMRTINCYGCFPESFDASSHSTGSEIKSNDLTCSLSYIEIT